MNNDSGVAVKRGIVLIVATVTAFITPFLAAAVNIAIPTLRRQFNMEAVAMTWVGTIFFLSVAVVQVPCGRLADIYGRRKLFIIGLLVTMLIRANRQKQKLAAYGLTEHYQQIFELTRLNEAIQIFGSEAEALTALPQA